MGPKNQAGSAGFHDALLSSPVAPKNSKRWASAKDVAPPTPLPASGSSPKPLSLLGGLKAAVKKKKK
ncbi:hypothetical protein PsYK624_063140 [Phanerochaete sordida]|uniref:Uncharacterized protein n=1 Tax=Phanerochaete sordida TaxID=48140 RepID=A0A9P3G8D8_9APHY|nr:hypothetical protein PsYK624_063140 [Phanerochaete sordida]